LLGLPLQLSRLQLRGIVKFFYAEQRADAAQGRPILSVCYTTTLRLLS
jgi:hypothetical protein